MAKKQPLYPHVPKNKDQRMPQTLDGNGQKDEIIHITREEVTETILRHLVRAGVLLPDETTRYRKVLEGYDNINLLKVLVHSKELVEARYG